MTDFQTFLIYAACFATGWLLVRGVALAAAELVNETRQFFTQQTKQR